MLEQIRALLTPLPPLYILALGALIISIISSGVFYVTICYIVYKLESRLRTPPKNWKSYLQEALDAGVTKLPEFGASKTAAIRRQLILASSKPSNYSNNVPMVLGTDVRKSSFEKKFNEQGQYINRKIVFGFFHPYANAGGGGERVLWEAVKQTLENHENNVCAIYIGRDSPQDTETPENILEKVDARFGIQVDDSRVVFIFISNRSLVHPATWPRLTLVGQAFGSCILAYEAVSRLVPDVFVDTTGYPFCYPLINWLLSVPICCYIHYPVIQRDMLNKVSKFSIKGIYWRSFMFGYGMMAKYATLPVTNSTWTNNHIKEIWSYHAKRPDLITTVYPPCAVQDFKEPDVSKERKPFVIYVAQFRPEKRHELLLREFATFVNNYHEKNPDVKPHLVLIGSVRDETDSQRVYSLRLLARELGIVDDNVTFLLDAPWTTIQEILNNGTVGVNTMWNEHFGMVVVEYMAAGLIPVVHDSAGPKLDIVTPLEDDETQQLPGFLFTDSSDPDYNKFNEKQKTLSKSLEDVFDMKKDEQDQLRLKAYKASQRFSDPIFDKQWDVRVNTLLKLEKLKRNKRLLRGSFD